MIGTTAFGLHPSDWEVGVWARSLKRARLEERSKHLRSKKGRGDFWSAAAFFNRTNFRLIATNEESLEDRRSRAVLRTVMLIDPSQSKLWSSRR